MNTKELLKKVRKIEIKTRKLSDNLFSGEYHSKFKGKGMTFSEVRPYAYGDDIRSIDWNVTARNRKPYVKIFEEERELTVMLAVDISGSENFGSKHQLKRETITEIAATLAFSAIKNNDKVGLILFSDRIELFIPPKKGRSHVLNIIRHLVDFEQQSKQTDIAGSLRYVFNVMKKRGIIFLISDFLDDNYADTLKIVAKKHDLIGIRVYDRFEKSAGNLGYILTRDAETGEKIYLDLSSKKVRNLIGGFFRKYTAYFQTAFRKSGSGIIEVETGQSYVKALINYFKSA
jgi:uncharacterized protein (DUF58 family)